MTGHGVGATYDRNRDVLWLLDQAQIDGRAGRDGRGRRRGHRRRRRPGARRSLHPASKAAHIVGDNRTIDADELDRLRSRRRSTLSDAWQLRGNSRIVGTGAGAQAMTAQDIDLTYGPDGRTLQTSKLMEQSVVQLPRDGGAAQRIAAQTIDMTMSPTARR